MKGPRPDENVTAKRETKSLPVFGEKHGPVYAGWCFDVCTAMEQVCEEVNLITQWVDSLDTLDETTEANFLVWVRTKGQNVLTQKLTGQVKEFTQAEMGKGIIRGATTWKRVQIHAAGMTHNRRLELLDAVSHPKKANSYDELAELLPAWEKKVCELEKFRQSALSNDQKIEFLRQLANDDLEQFLSHWSVTGGQTYGTLRVYAESQIAQKRTAQSYHQGKTSDKKIGKTRGNAMDLGNLDNASKTDDQETRQEEFDPWQKYAGQGFEVLDASGKEKEGWPINGNCDHCGPRLDEAGKAAMAQRKGQLFKGSQKGNNGMKGSWTGPSWTSGSCGKAGQGFQTRPWAQTQYGKGFGKQKRLNEVSDWSQDVWDLSGIHALTDLEFFVLSHVRGARVCGVSACFGCRPTLLARVPVCPKMFAQRATRYISRW